MREFLAAVLRDTPALYWSAAAAAALIVETFYAYDKSQPVRMKLLNVANGCAVCAAIFIFTPMTRLAGYEIAHKFGFGFIDMAGFFGHGPAGEIAGAIIIVFFDDLLFYFWHRAEHTIPVFWDIHAVHHSDTSLNATSYLRQHWLETSIQRLIITIPLFLLFRMSPLQVSILLGCGIFFAFFSHMNVPLELGRLTPVFTGPQLHKLHHSRRKKHWNSNYAQIFPVIDIIFGTYIAPQQGEFPPTGLISREHIETMPNFLLWPFKRWAQRFDGIIKSQLPGY